MQTNLNWIKIRLNKKSMFFYLILFDFSSSLFQILIPITKQGGSYLIACFGCSSLGCLGPFKIDVIQCCTSSYSPSKNVVSLLIWQKLCKTQQSMIMTLRLKLVIFATTQIVYNIIHILWKSQIFRSNTFG